MASLHQLLSKTLETKRLSLELYDHSAEHHQCLLEGINSPASHARMGDLGLRTPEDFDAFIAKFRLRGSQFTDGVADVDCYYMMRLKSDGLPGKLIGAISLAQRFAGSRLLPPDIGWMVCEPYMGNGYATEAAGSVLGYATEDLGFKEIVVFPSATNEPSNRVAAKIGFVDGGTVSEADRPGQVVNVLVLPGMDKLDIKGAMSFGMRN
jgi:RimJ/RimL family protein N-acetyltransferase